MTRSKSRRRAGPRGVVAGSAVPWLLLVGLLLPVGRLGAASPAKKPLAPPAGNAGPSTPASADATGTPGTANPGTAATVAKARPWPVPTDEQQAAATRQRKAFAESVGQKMGISLQLKETRYFLFYTDLPAREADNWAGLLDHMYDRLAELFAVPKAKPPAGATSLGRGPAPFVNLWRGKAVIFVFKQAKDYHAFHQGLGAAGGENTAGMCFSYVNGDVAIGFYRQEDEITFAHVLVHESVHGFIHRYKSPAVIPSWANEGLAEVIAFELVEQVKRPAQVAANQALARRQLQAHENDLGGFYTAAHIQGWQYPVAHTLAGFMIQQSKSRYVAFINGMKEGLTWEQSLNQKYGVTLDRLTEAYGAAMGAKGLKP